jgi:hypothetical protein
MNFVDTPDGVWHDALQCFIERIEIDCARRYATLWLPAHNCTDMKGAIKFVGSIDPRISRIYTLRGGEPDRCYSSASGAWVSTHWERVDKPEVMS